jgi:hypothetical protein
MQTGQAILNVAKPDARWSFFNGIVMGIGEAHLQLFKPGIHYVKVIRCVVICFLSPPDRLTLGVVLAKVVSFVPNCHE